MIQPEMPLRIIVIYSSGLLFSFLFSTLQIQREVTYLPIESFSHMHIGWWVPVIGGFLALAIGLLVPKVDRYCGQAAAVHCDWSSLIRCYIIFFGINHACSKIDFGNSHQLSAILTVLAIGVWFLFDRTVAGLCVGFIFTIIVLSITQVLVMQGFAKYKKPDFFLVRSWLPSLVFSSVVTFGTIGRHLSAIKLTTSSHEHVE